MLTGMGLIIARSALFLCRMERRQWWRDSPCSLLLVASGHSCHFMPLMHSSPPCLAVLAPARPRLPASACSQCVQAAQITFEDFFMADLAIPPLKIVGYEGVLGAATMLLLVLPIVQVGAHWCVRWVCEGLVGSRHALQCTDLPYFLGALTCSTVPLLLPAAPTWNRWQGAARGLCGHLACEAAALHTDTFRRAAAPHSSCYCCRCWRF